MSNALRRTTPAIPRIRTESDGMKTMEVDGRIVTYLDAGSGPTIILVHCSGGSHKQWLPLIARLSGQYRVLAPDLVGYGKSDPWPIHAKLHPWSDLNVVLGLAAIAGEPVHIAGHSYGGAVALEAARVLGPRVKSLALVEPVALHLLRLTGRASEWKEVRAAGHSVVQAVRDWRERKAAAVFMGYWVGRWRWWLMPARARRRLVSTVGKVAAEFELLEALTTTIGDYRAIQAPTRLVVGDRTRQPARAIVDELMGILPDASLHVISNAGHMSALTHPTDVGELIAEHVDAVEAASAHATQGVSGRRRSEPNPMWSTSGHRLSRRLATG